MLKGKWLGDIVVCSNCGVGLKMVDSGDFFDRVKVAKEVFDKLIGMAVGDSDGYSIESADELRCIEKRAGEIADFIENKLNRRGGDSGE